MNDVDGMPIAPKEVNENSAWFLFGPAIGQSKTWHEPKKSEKEAQNNIFKAFYKSVKNGISKETTSEILSNSYKLGLNVCRSTQILEPSGEKDSVLIFYTKPGVKSYSGPFLILRETKPSNIVILSPHDGSDGTSVSTKLAIQNSRALAMISNGHKKGISPNADFVDHVNTLGSIALRQLQDLFLDLVVLMIHGKKGSSSISYRGRSNVLAKAFEKGSMKYTNINHFGSFNADYATDKIVKTSFYIKVEIPVRIHMNNKPALAGIIRTIEENSWAWGSNKNLINDAGDFIGIDEDEIEDHKHDDNPELNFNDEF